MRRMIMAAIVAVSPMAASADPATPRPGDIIVTSQGSRVSGESTEYSGVSISKAGADGRAGTTLIRNLTITGGTLEDLRRVTAGCAPLADGRRVTISGTGLEAFGDGDASSEADPRERFAADTFTVNAVTGDACLFPESAEIGGMASSAADGSTLFAARGGARFEHMRSASVTLADLRLTGGDRGEMLRASGLALSARIENAESPAAGKIDMTSSISGIETPAGRLGSAEMGFSCDPERLSVKAASDVPGILVMRSDLAMLGNCGSPGDLKLVSGSLDVTEGKGFADVARAGLAAVLSGSVESVPQMIRSGLEMKKDAVYAALDKIAAGNLHLRLSPQSPVGVEQVMGGAMMGEEALKKVIGLSYE